MIETISLGFEKPLKIQEKCLCLQGKKPFYLPIEVPLLSTAGDQRRR
jgi:hypothetical protein